MRGRRQERRDERHGDGRVHYKMRQRLVSIGDDFWIEDDSGTRVYKVDGKALRLRKTLILEDIEGNKLAKIQAKVLRIKDAMEVEDADGNRLAMVKKALISPLRERWSVEVEDGPDLDIKGNIVDHEYTFTDGRHCRWPPCPSSGSGWPTRTAWRSSRTRTRSSCSPRRSRST